MDQENYDNTKMRLQILLDAFQTTLLPAVHIRVGSYAYAVTEDYSTAEATDVAKAFQEGRTCEVCLLGTMVLKQLTKMDLGTLGEVNFSTHWGLKGLNEHFDDKTLALAEALFEGRAVRGVLRDFWEENPALEQRMDLIADKLPLSRLDSTSRAQVILQHMIENEGRVDVDQLERGEYTATPNKLSDKALLVLKSYDINPFAVEQGRGG